MIESDDFGMREDVWSLRSDEVFGGRWFVCGVKFEHFVAFGVEIAAIRFIGHSV